MITSLRRDLLYVKSHTPAPSDFGSCTACCLLGSRKSDVRPRPDEAQKSEHRLSLID
jgi:hypothetical protein